MTCVVGLKDKGRVWMGADSFGSSSFNGEVYENRKVFHSRDTKEMVMGFTTSFRMGDLLEYATDLIDKVDILEHKTIDREYVVTKIIPNISRLFLTNKWERNIQGEADGGTFLLAIKDKLYKIQDEYSVLEPRGDYITVGSGSYYADGSLHSTRDMELKPHERILKALESAEYHQLNVRRPFVIVNTLDDEVIVIE